MVCDRIGGKNYEKNEKTKWTQSWKPMVTMRSSWAKEAQSMVSLIKAKKAEVGEGILGEFLADSKEDTLPTEVEWKRASLGDTFKGKILPGSICYTPALDTCIMANDGTWGPWL